MTFAERMADLRARMATDDHYRAFVEAQRQGLHRELKVTGVVQPQDTNEWWHCCEGRFGRAAIIAGLTGDEKIAEWLHDAAMWIVRQDADAWIGPFFRRRTTPLSGTLETAHICRALTAVLLFCPQILSEAETAEVRAAIYEKGLPPIDHWLKPYFAHTNASRNNWVIAELGAAMSVCSALGDKEKLRTYLPLFNELHEDFNSDFYGEPVGYWSYACINFLSARLFTEWVYPELSAEMEDVQTVIRPIVWAYYHRQGYFLLQNSDRRELRSMTFGDCSTWFDINELTVLYASLYVEDPRVRSLISAWYDELYVKTKGEDLDFSDHAGMAVIMLYPLREKGNPDASFLPPSRLFGDGFLMYKDRWDDAKIQIAVQTGVSEIPRVISHRHADHLSFQLAKDGIVILDDPSRCTYRLHTQQLSTSASWHSVPSFTTDEEKPRLLEQKIMIPACRAENTFDRLLYSHIGEDGFAVSSEAGAIYPAELSSVRRSFAAVGESVLLIVDSYSSDVPVFETATFLGNNRRQGMKWTFTEDGTVLIREGVGVRVKAMQPVEMVMDYAALHDCYSITPDSPLQGREGSGYLVRVKNKESATAGRSIYLVFADKEEKLESWNAALEGDTVTVTQNGEAKYTFDLSGDEITYRSL